MKSASRTRRHLAILALIPSLLVGLAGVVAPPASGATNPVPLINQPLVPDAIAPGGAGFTLTVRGTGFVSGSVVNWNGSARATTFVSASQLMAAVLASDIATASTASVTVVNPSPGGGISNVDFFQIVTAESAVGFSQSDSATGSAPYDIVTGDFNKDGKLDVAVANETNPATISILLGKGDGTFQPPITYNSATAGFSVLTTGDFNNDGKLDLATTDDSVDAVSVLLGNGDGTFQSAITDSVGFQAIGPVTGDFNGDGKLDLAVGDLNSGTVYILLGNGDGTFQSPTGFPNGSIFGGDMRVGDFNGDGKLDLIVLVAESSNSFYVLLGNGDGTFQAPVGYGMASYFTSSVVADFNGDGKLDVAFIGFLGLSNSVSVLFGNGDGTFGREIDYAFAGPSFPLRLATGDFNGDGKLDLVALDDIGPNFMVSVLLGNGDGTFQPAVTLDASGYWFSFVAGDFNNDGRLDLVGTNDTTNSASVLVSGIAGSSELSATSLVYGNELVGTTSPPQTVTLTNMGNGPLTVSSISLTGPDPGDFSQTNTCPTSPSTLAAGTNCTLSVTFTPAVTGSLTASVSITSSSLGSPQTISLSGTGVEPVVSLSPTSLGFAVQVVGTTSFAQTVKLTNTGSAALTISGVSTSGDFAQTNTCGTSVAINATCTFSVTFKPTRKGARTGTLSITDNAPGSPQTVALSGTSTIVKLSLTRLGFGSVPVGTQSIQDVIISNASTNGTLHISKFTISGSGAGAFKQTNTCGGSVPPGKDCTVTVTFTPVAKHSYNATMSIYDDGGASPQTVSLSGTGT
ncbi:MAG TPA: FG-GAP-like repeat-containing protein [Terriglobia bacterium]|nr:FG-GAP-like repeat-containing protein [Terriglobia bacterium]